MLVGSSLNTVDFVKGGEVRNLTSWCQDSKPQHQRRADKGQQEVAGCATPQEFVQDRVCSCVPSILHLRFTTYAVLCIEEGACEVRNSLPVVVYLLCATTKS